MKKILILFMAAMMTFSCSKMNKTTKGGIIGAGAGGAIGGVIGNKTGNTAAGAIIGATVGGAAGAVIGHYMDKQAEELRRDIGDNAKIERVGEGIKITFNSGILFDVNSANLRPEAKENLNDLAKTLNKYDDTEVLIEGHTDNTGTTEYNEKLSEDRAESVEKYLHDLGVKNNRVEMKGYGESEPIADNSTEAGRQSNRRVEVAIYANKKLKKAAEKGDLGKIESDTSSNGQ